MSKKRQAAATIHDIWTDALVCDVSASVVLRGPQDVKTWQGEDSRGRHIACRIGRVLVYLFDADAITSHVTTWKKAEGLAVRAFPSDYEAQPPRNAKDPERPLTVGSVVLQCQREQRPVRADAATTAAAGLPYVQVQVGRLVVVCLDDAAFMSCLQGWQSAVEAAENWLIDPDAVLEQRRVIAAFERNWTRSSALAAGEAPQVGSHVDLRRAVPK
jgi:hypothetical protein